MPKHPNRIKSIASGKRDGLPFLLLTTYGGEKVACSSHLLSQALGGKLPTLGADIETYRWAALPKEATRA